MSINHFSTFLLLATSALSTSALLPLRSTDSSTDAPSNKGTFHSPSAQVRPKFRYWIPDASVDPAVVASDVQAAGAVGAGGLECLGYYLYGGPPNNAGRGNAAPVSWATYGFGTDAWNALFKSMVQAHKDNGLVMDFSMGPNQGTGVPAEYNSDGLMWDLVLSSATVPIGGSFNGTLPGWGTGALEAAVIGLALKSESTSSVAPGLPGDLGLGRTQITLAANTLQDVTGQVDHSGNLEIQFNTTNTTGLYYNIFAIYLIHDHYRAQDGPRDIGGPQTPPETLAQNGSWAVDHFSELGAETMTGFWEQNILQNGTRELLTEAGNYGWEDSVEIQANVYWTKNFTSIFQADHGYSIRKWFPLIFHRNGKGKNSNPGTWWVTDEDDGGVSHIADYRETLTNQYRKYLTTLTSWAENYLGLKFSAQISYNLPMDMLSNIPSVDVPECESLDFSDLIDGYRQYSGPAYLSGKSVVSSECGAVLGEAFAFTLPELLWKVKRSFAGGINQFVFHGFPYSGNYGQTTWPVFTTFNYLYSTMHGPHEPAWDFYRDQLDFVARNNYILQSGTPKMDVAFWQKITTYPGHITQRTYGPIDLELAGYSYEYLSPDNFNLPSATVEGGILAPDAQGFKVLVVRANDSLTIDGASKLAGFAQAGLPIVFSGGIPTSYLGTNDAGELSRSKSLLDQIASRPNVHVTSSYDGLASTLASIGIQPAVKLNVTVPWYSFHRRDAAAQVDYFYLYNDAMKSPLGQGGSSALVEFDSTGVPYEFNAWTGEQTPIISYQQTDTSTSISITLAGNQSTIVAFLPEPLDGYPKTLLKDLPESTLGVSVLQNGSLLLKVGSSNSQLADPNTPDNDAQKPIALRDNAQKPIISRDDAQKPILGRGESQKAIVEKDNAQSATSAPNISGPITLQNWTLTVEHWDPPADLSNIEGGAAKSNTTHSLRSLVPWRSISGLENVSGRGFYNSTFEWPPAGYPATSGAIINFGPVVHTLRVFINGKQILPLDVTHAQADISDNLVKGTNMVEAVVATPLGNVLRPIWNSLLTSGTGPTDPVAGGPPPPWADYGLIQDVVLTPYIGVIVD
ncbi:hypothetical protein F5884DRAFT_302871 [Xylogone sp. PMI_703]|nr:hypothetical protein F5884DRAFT_302871 [Xylogone sp. PMI_703]